MLLAVLIIVPDSQYLPRCSLHPNLTDKTATEFPGSSPYNRDLYPLVFATLNSNPPRRPVIPLHLSVMPDIGHTNFVPLRALDKTNKSDVFPPPLEFQRDDVVDSMSTLHAVEYVSAKHALAQDCATLRLIEDDMEECRARIARAQSQIRSLERQRDAVQRRVSIHRARLSPLRAVPDQILQEIFQHCLPDTPYIVPNVHTAPVVLTHVCRRWRVVAHGTSELWSSIALHDRGMWNYELKMEMAKRWLDRSRLRPLRMSITCPPHTDFGPSGDPLCSDVFRLATAHSSQLSDLCLTANRTYLRQFMDRTRLPGLRSIVISLHNVHRIDEPQEPIAPPLLSVPNLQHVAFKGAGSSIDLFPRNLFSQITRLSFDCGLTLDLALLFQDFPSLEHLTLSLSLSRDALRFRQPPQNADRKAVVVSSPSLRCLEVCLDEGMLRAGERTKLEMLLDQLALPALETLAITVAASLHSQLRFRVRSGSEVGARSVGLGMQEVERGPRETLDAATAAWARNPSVASLLSRSSRSGGGCAARPSPRFEFRDLSWPSSPSLASLLLRTAAAWTYEGI